MKTSGPTNSNSHPYPALPIRVIHTKGSDFEIGRQHGELLQESVSKGMSRFYLDFWRRMMGTRRSISVEGVFLELGKLLIDPVLVSLLKRNVPAWASDRLRGIAQVTSFNENELQSTLILPDLMPMLQAYLGVVRPSALIEAAHPPRFGCTSFFAKDKSFYQGRNLDFPGVSYWDRYPVIQMYERNGALRYIGFATAGVPIAGITGVNEAQIMVALHQHYSRATALNGVLPFVISERILSEARTLKEAVEILESEKVASSWAFVVSDGKTGEGFLQECDPKGSGKITYSNSDEILTHANYFQTKECQRREYATTARMNWDNYSRRTRLYQLLSQEKGNYSIEKLVSILSDHYDPYWGEEKTINRTVSQVYNIQSLVINVTDMKAYMAEGDSPVQLRQYVEFDLGDIFRGGDGRTGKSIAGYQFKDEKKKKAKIDYILSFVAAFDGDFDRAIVSIEKSLESDFSAEAALVYSILQMKKGNYDTSVESLSQAKAFIEKRKNEKGLGVFPPEYFEICLFLGRALDLLDRREEALVEYRHLASHVDLEDANVRKLATSKKPYSKAALSKILMPYSTYIPFE